MAGIGKWYTFHGCFTKKVQAVGRERLRPGSFVKKCKKTGLYCVLKPK